ncbi:hypothetical protein D3C85_1027530 [compost metagenome]
MTQSSGVTVTAVTQLSSNETVTTWNSERQNSPVASFEVPIAAKARIAIRVAPSSGQADCLTTVEAARSALSPFCMRMSTPSTTTMALSTSMPSAMINAPSEIRSSATPIGSRNRKEPAMVNSSTKPISSPLRRPMNSSRTATTMATASSRLSTKPEMAVVTASDCRDTMPNSMPTGRCPSSSAMRA